MKTFDERLKEMSGYIEDTVRNFARSFRADPDEIRQQMYIKLWQVTERYPELAEDKYLPMLRTCIYNDAISKFRRTKRRAEVSFSDHFGVGGGRGKSQGTTNIPASSELDPAQYAEAIDELVKNVSAKTAAFIRSMVKGEQVPPPPGQIPGFKAAFREARQALA